MDFLYFLAVGRPDCYLVRAGVESQSSVGFHGVRNGSLFSSGPALTRATESSSPVSWAGPPLALTCAESSRLGFRPRGFGGTRLTADACMEPSARVIPQESGDDAERDRENERHGAVGEAKHRYEDGQPGEHRREGDE